jgi:DNA repair exonuclease SbcCD ATPase subunit
VKDTKSAKAKKELAHARKEIARLEAAQTQQRIETEQHLMELRSVKSNHAQLEADFAATQSQLNELRTKMEVEKNVPRPMQLSVDVFANVAFEAELMGTIQKIVSSAALTPLSKIQSCLKAITLYYNQRIHVLEEGLAARSRDFEDLSRTLNEFLMDLTIALNDQPLTIETVENQKGLKQIVQGVSHLRQANADLNHALLGLKEFAAHFTEVFGNVDECSINAVDLLKRSLADQHSLAARKAKEVKSLKRENAQLAAVLTKVQSEHSSRLTEVTQNFESVSQELETATVALRAAETENQRLQSELNTVRRSLKRFQTQSGPSAPPGDPSVPQIAANLTAVQREYGDLQQKYGALLEESRAEADKSRQLNEKQRLEIGRLQRQLAEAATAISRASESLTERLESEKAELREAHERLLGQLRHELAEQRNDIKRLSLLLEEADHQNAVLRQANAKLAKRGEKAAREAHALKAASTKEKQLAKLSVVASRVSLEGEFDERVNDLRTRVEAEKRRLIAWAAEAFKEFFDPQEEMNERSFRAVVSRACEELDRLSGADQSVRRLLAVPAGQTTEDAVARLVIGEL